MARQKDLVWNAGPNGDGTTTHDQAKLAVLMDVRDELKLANVYLRDLRDIMTCGNAVDIPNILRRIDKNTKKSERKKKVVSA